MHTYVILRRAAWATNTDLEKAVGVSSRVGLVDLAEQVRWIRSYVIRETDGRLGMICIFQSTDANTLREHATRAGIPADEIIPIGETIVLQDDPLPGACSGSGFESPSHHQHILPAVPCSPSP